MISFSHRAHSCSRSSVVRGRRAVRRRRALRAVVASALCLTLARGAHAATSAGAASAAGTSGAEAAETWRRDEPCGVLLEPPRAATRPRCDGAHCVDAGDGAEICACRVATDVTAAAGAAGADTAAAAVRATGAPDDPVDAMGTVRLASLRDGREQRAWTADPMLGETSAFRVARADLDGDGRDELVVGILDGVSNGMAVQSWTVCALEDGADTSGEGPARRLDPRACVAADDFPFFSLPTHAPGERGCRLLAARWRWGSEPGRADGLYLVGRWHALRDGVLESDDARPGIARRYLYRFAAQRAALVESGATAPVAWWRDATTRVLRCPDPRCDDGGSP